MKKENVVSGIKTAAVVATAVLTLNSCGNRKMSEKQMQIVEQKTDSAQRVHPGYKMASGLYDLCEIKIREYRESNRTLVRKTAQGYIKRYIKDINLRNFMLNSIQDEALMQKAFFEDVDSELDSVESNTVDTMSYIRKNERWFNDLMMYLTYMYDERQLLNSEFFKVLNNKDLRGIFEYNTRNIEKLKEYSDFTAERKNSIHNEIRNKYVEEAKHLKIR
ncbi:MAG: hypothetical protein IKN73_03565 [Alphaproteobacteria bacterium]|nr:hypothetical protein [Alphaproteobacteria bacterium]